MDLGLFSRLAQKLKGNEKDVLAALRTYNNVNRPSVTGALYLSRKYLKLWAFEMNCSTT